MSQSISLILIFRHDVSRAIDTLKPLGAGITIMTFGNEKFLKTVPIEMSTDMNQVLELVIFFYLTHVSP
jgi:hypothetical protein